MTTSKRVVLSLLVAAVILFLAMLYWPLVVNNILRPTALVLWLLLRILVLSIHQKYFWYAMIFAAFIVLFRVLPQEQTEVQSEAYGETNAALINIGYWRGLFVYNGQSVQDQKNLKRQLAHLLTSLYASKQGTSSNFRLEEALQQGRIPLPENIHTFLFLPETPAASGPLKRFLHSIRKTPRKWIRQWSGQEKAEHFQMIDEVLSFMEASLEVKNDDSNLSQDKH